MPEPGQDNTDVDARDPNQSPEWLSYLMPRSSVLRTVAGLTDPTAVAGIGRFHVFIVALGSDRLRLLWGLYGLDWARA